MKSMVFAACWFLPPKGQTAHSDLTPKPLSQAAVSASSSHYSSAAKNLTLAEQKWTMSLIIREKKPKTLHSMFLLNSHQRSGEAILLPGIYFCFKQLIHSTADITISAEGIFPIIQLIFIPVSQFFFPFLMLFPSLYVLCPYPPPSSWKHTRLPMLRI